MKTMVMLVATAFHVGRLPFVPGTWGSLVGIGLYFLLAPLSLLHYCLTVVAFIFFSVWISTQAQTILGQDDPKEIVIDEIAGFLVAMVAHPFSVATVVVGFLFFRLFDILKPFPCRWLEKRFASSGWGVVLDDVMAGMYTNLVLWGLHVTF